MRTANPAFNEKVFRQVGRVADPSHAMTVSGTVNKAGILFVLLLLPAAWLWNRYAAQPAGAQPWMLGGLLVGFGVAMITVFKRNLAGVTAPIYAVCEGLAVGGISLFYSRAFAGIVPQAVGLTFGTLFVLLGIYRAGWIRVTDKFRLGVVAATGAIALVYVVSLVLGMFGTQIPLIHGSGLIGIGFSLVVVGVASMNLVLDFDLIERGAASGAPKYMEWYAAFGLMVTLVWLYLEMLRLLAKLSGRR